jgi:hypothetical protein
VSERVVSERVRVRGEARHVWGGEGKELLLPITYYEHGGGQTGIGERTMIS